MAGRVSSTKNRRPRILIYLEEYPNKKQAWNVNDFLRPLKAECN